MRDFFFTFPDGSLDFDCAACGGACCRGHGFGGARNPALADFLRAHPSLDLIVDPADRDDVNLATTRTGCPLQDADGRCTYHLERGLEAKPTICRLFPFNLVRQIGETLFVAPHHLCPFELVVPPAPGEVQGSHRELRRMLGAMESEIVSMRKDLPLPLDAVAAVRRERSFLGYAASRLGVSSF